VVTFLTVENQLPPPADRPRSATDFASASVTRAAPNRFAVFALLLLASWVVMTSTHEVGHIAAGWLGGATLTDYDLAPWRLPYSLHSSDPSPLFTLWGGPVFGVLAPALVAASLGAWWAWFIADFCLIANGGYLVLAWFSGARYLDTQRMLSEGAHPATIVIFCLATIGLGYVRFRSDCIRCFARTLPETQPEKAEIG